MRDDSRDLPLSRRVPGATRTGPASLSTARLVLPESLLRRMRAAVDAAHAQMAEEDQEPPTEPLALTPADATPTWRRADVPAADKQRTAAAKVQAARMEQSRASPVKATGWMCFGRARLAAAVVILAVAGPLLTMLALHSATAGGSGRRGPGQSDRPAASQASLATRNLAAAWIDQQLTPAATVSCDQQMCSALADHGFPAGNLRVLGPTSAYPRDSTLVIDTPAVRSLFGTSLDADWAPAVIATFGSGRARIAVRLIAPHGAAAYQAALSADLLARKQSGAYLLATPQITTSAIARRQLATGQVDSRLVVLIADLASNHPLDIVRFDNPGPGASADVPLRFADLAEHDQAAHMATSAYVASMLRHLGPQLAQYRPAGPEQLVLRGQLVLRIAYLAPSPLGLIGPR